MTIYVMTSVVVLLLNACGVVCADKPHAALSGYPTGEGFHDGANRLRGELFVRTELFFGSAKPDGSEVTGKALQQFVDTEVTPRFPQGLTLFVGRGQFRKASGAIIQERAIVLILLYPLATRGDSSEQIEQIRQAYKKAFQQESVLRADRCCDAVGF